VVRAFRKNPKFPRHPICLLGKPQAPVKPRIRSSAFSAYAAIRSSRTGIFSTVTTVSRVSLLGDDTLDTLNQRTGVPSQW